MEEKKNVVNEQPEKLSYEQLENVCRQLTGQNRELYTKLQELSTELASVNRLDYLFKVVENNHVFPKDFVDTTVKEIISAVTIPQEETKES